MTLRTDAADVKLEQRYDRAELLRPVRLPNGTMVAEGIVAKEGILEYPEPGGKVRRELVTLETLKQSADSLSDLPLTLLHPDPSKYPDGVTPENVAELAIGNTGERIDLLNGGHTKLHIAVRRRDGLDAIEKDGVRELSLGYGVELDNTPGNHPEFGRYDAIQRRRVHNHVALVPKGRFGASVGMRIDAAHTVEPITSGGTSATTTPGRMAPQGGLLKPIYVQLAAAFGISDSRCDSEEALVAAVTAAERQRKDAEARAEQTRADAATKQATDHKAEIDKLTGERDVATARADAAERDLKKIREEQQARADAAERTELETLAKGLNVDAAKHPDGKALRKAIATAHMGGELKADASDAYIEAVVDLARKQHARDDSDEGREDSRAVWDSQEPPADAGARNDGPPARQSQGNRQGLGARQRALYSSAGQPADGRK